MARAARSSNRGPSREECAARDDVIATARSMSASGLSPGRSGNVSRRWGNGMLITPSGIAYDAIATSDIVHVDHAGQPSGTLKPSSEWRFHLAAYAARRDMDAIVHAHSMYAVVLACARKPIPAFHYMVAVAGGDDIPCVPYATFGTEALARHVSEGLAARDACLMAHHGQIALGRSLARALDLAREVETLAEQYVKVLGLGRAHLLGDAEMAEVIERFKDYGQRAQEK